MRSIHYALYREDADWVAQCLDFDVSSFGASQNEALANLKEAVELFGEEDSEAIQFPRIAEVTVGEIAVA